MAMTLAGHVHRKVSKNAAEPGMDVRHLEITKPIIAKGQKSKDPQIIKITATAEKPLKVVNVKYTSLAEDGKTWNLNAECSVEYGDSKEWLANWARLAYLIQPRVDLLNQGVKTKATEKLDRKTTYERFAALVQYGKKYCGMKEVVLDSKNFEATSIVDFQTTDNDGDFDVNPYWIDNVTHLSGLILNGSDAVDSSKTVYISHGWESFQMGRPLSGTTLYRSYVKMQPGTGKTMVGDVYVFDGQEIVGLIRGVKFQAIPRAVLNKLLPPAKGYVPPIFLKAPKAKETKTQAPAKAATTAQAVAAPAAAPRQNNAAAEQFLSIIADELGMEPSELPDTALFDDIGVDSLMSLSMTGRIREELDLDVPTSLFTDHPTIGEAKVALFALQGGPVSQSAEQFESPPQARPEEPVEVSEDVLSHQQLVSSDQSDNDSVIHGILDILSDELGMEQSELPDTAVFDDIGVDSLMSLSITGRIREELDLDVPTSFFTDHPTIGEAKSAVRSMMGAYTNGTATSNGSTGITTPDQDTEDNASLDAQFLENEKRNLPATSILLQGNPKTASKILFLFPDGSGSATSYAAFPRIDRDVCVYGLNCPFMKTPTDYTNGIVGVSSQYIAEIQRRQEHGPYYLGGWSAGGVLAYQSASKLMEMGETVERLILIDSPCPIDLEPLPSSLLHFIDSIGLLGSQNSRGTPEWLIPHFEASIANLTAYKPQPMGPSKAPKTYVIWGRDGLLKDHRGKQYARSADEATSITFLLDSRANIGFNGWEKLLGAENMTASDVEGNHFTMIRDPIVSFYFPQSLSIC
jgi:iterative type I PKS product template protein